MKNMEELLSIITKAMSEKDIELTHVDLYEQAVEINNKVKVCIGATGRGNEVWFLVRKTDTKACVQFQLYSTTEMLDKVLELLTENDWLPGDDIESYGEWCTLVVEESKYYIPGTAEERKYYRLLNENYNLSEKMTLNYLKSNYTNVSLEKRLK